ncbi:hypothetical protein B296_00019169 [Ensete ventricosum]|uniref:Uncharacterized protein n=1 Tax=Ensete ventricosum TaxID=4639 RepID=A0A427AKD6_ENSVE|nr:hypothetical protein B296_00019169 [Ensete ventricosum]
MGGPPSSSVGPSRKRRRNATLCSKPMDDMEAEYSHYWETKRFIDSEEFERSFFTAHLPPPSPLFPTLSCL